MKNTLKFRLTRHFLSLAMGVGMLGVLIVGNVGTALADGGNGTFTVNGVAASESDSGVTVNGGSSVTLGATDQTVNISLPVTVTDFSGTGSGWNVTLGATAFTTTSGGTTHTIQNDPKVAASPTVAQLNPGGGNAYTYTNPTDTGNKIVSSLTSLVSSPQVIANADAGTGMGKFTITPTISLKILANDYASISGHPYTSTFTVTFANSPAA